MKKTNALKAFLAMGLMAWGASSFAHDEEELICNGDYWTISVVEEIKNLNLDKNKMNQICGWGDNDLRRVVHAAFKHAPASVLREILKIEGLYFDSRDSFGNTLLMLALLNRRGEEIAELLIMEEKVDIDAQNEDGWSALIYAAYHGYKEVVRLLLKAGANIDFKVHISGSEWSASDLARNKGHLEIDKMIKEERKRRAE